MSEPTPPTALDEAFLSPKAGGTDLYFIRHADALPGAEEVVRGHYDDQPLSELGRKQAAALAERLRDVKLDAIYSAPLGRARATAQAIADVTGLQIGIVDGLREVELGAIEGTVASNATTEEVSVALRETLRQIAVIALRDRNWSAIPGSEPSAAIRARMAKAVRGIVTQHPGQRVAVVSHGGSINAWFADVLGIDDDYFFPMANTAISLVRVKGPRSLVMALNDIGHLFAAGLMRVEP